MTPEKKPSNVIHTVVERDRCSGCGVCAGICPGKFLTMTDAPNGDLIAQWSVGPCATDCGLCLAVCPFGNGIFDPRPLNQAVFGVSECTATKHVHEDVGYFENALAGYAETHRSTSASGGLLTWTLEQLLSRSEVDRIGIVVCQPDIEEGSRFVFKVAKTIEDLRQGAGSAYHQVEISGILQHIMQNPGHRWAITGVPCLCAAIRQAMQRVPSIGRSIRYLFGLACGMYQNRFYTELLCCASGVQPQYANRIQYRIKASAGPASNFRFQATARNGWEGKAIEYHGLPYFLGRNAFFRVNACNYCKDVFAETADACFMDAWLPAYQNDTGGTSVILVRNHALRSLFNTGIKAPDVFICPIDVESVVASQAGHINRKRYLTAMRQGESHDKRTGKRFLLSDRIDWLVHRHVQLRSKGMWLKKGRTKGYLVFLMSMWDLCLVVLAVAVFNKALRHSLRLKNIFSR